MAEKTTKTVKKISNPVAKVAPKAKTVAKSVKQESVKAEVPVSVRIVKKPANASTNTSVSIDVVGLDGKVTGKISLPGEIFGEKVNKQLIAQAVRVYLANQRQGNASTKTRGEVDGSTRKIYRQKGTGRARHGGIRAPIFVKGGIVFGPKPRDFSLSLPQKMKRKALFSALSAKIQSNELTVISGLGDIKPKTKEFVTLLKNLGVSEKKVKALFITSGVSAARRAGSNIQGVQFLPVSQLNTYEVLNTRNLVLAKEAVEEIGKHFLGKDK